MIRSCRMTSPTNTQIGMPAHQADHQPLVGPDLRIAGLYWATGHFTMGILLAPATARAIADLIDVGRSTIPIGAFGVERFAVAQRV